MKSRLEQKILYRWGRKDQLSENQRIEHKKVLIFNRINKNGPIIYPELGQCWIYEGVRNRAGYGVLMTSRSISQDLVHRLMYELAYKIIIPERMHILHKCDNPPCCRPTHLFLGTQEDNMQDMAKKGRTAKAKLTASQVKIIKEKYINEDVSLAQLGKEFGVHLSTISLIVRGINWKHVP